jgi:hypothetical protein
MGIRLFVGEIDELGIKIPRGYNYVHYARAYSFSYVMSINSI